MPALPHGLVEGIGGVDQGSQAD